MKKILSIQKIEVFVSFSGAYFMFHTVLLPKIICCDFCTFFFFLYGVSVLGFVVTIGASRSVLFNGYEGSEMLS